MFIVLPEKKKEEGRIKEEIALIREHGKREGEEERARNSGCRERARERERGM